MFAFGQWISPLTLQKETVGALCVRCLFDRKYDCCGQTHLLGCVLHFLRPFIPLIPESTPLCDLNTQGLMLFYS